MVQRGRAYIDTSILVGAIIDKPYRAQEFDSLIKRVKSKYRVVIPQIVIGECIAKISDRSKSHELTYNALTKFVEKIVDILDNEPKDQIPSVKKDIIRFAIDLKEQKQFKHDYSIDICDCIIIAHAVLDEKADYLFTTGKVVRNIALHDYIKRHNKRLIISDSI